MTKSSSGAKCKVQQVQVRVRVEVAPALSGRESVGGRALWVERAGVPRKLQLQELQELPPFSCTLAPLWKLSLSFGLKLQKPPVPAV